MEREGIVAVGASGNGAEAINAIMKPSWGSNVISVGAARSLGDFPDSLFYVGPPALSYSSSGPTEDGRCKPDLIAPGISLGPDGHSDEGYIRRPHGVGYSSFAAPQAAGAAALLIDAARRYELPEAEDPRVIKALLLNGAVKLTGWHKGGCDPEDDATTPLDYRQGAGLLNVWGSFRHLLAGRYGERPLVYDPNYLPGNYGWDRHRVSLDPNDPNCTRVYYLPEPLKEGENFTATLCWYRHYRQEGIFVPLGLTTLTLELWSVDAQGQLRERLEGSYSFRDNVQHIHYASSTKQQVVLLVGSAGEEASTGSEVYGLAYGCGQPGWSGDQYAGDLNADGLVGVEDLMRLLKAWWGDQRGGGPDGDDPSAADLDANGVVDKGDFDILRQQWQKRSPWRR